jgi:hypothetical protein
MLKKLCQCIGLASLVLLMNSVDLLGGGANVRMHVPYRLTGICLAEIADILILGLALFVVLVAFRRERYYMWVRLLFVFLVPPVVIEQTKALFPFDLKDWVVAVFAAAWLAVLLVLLLKFPSRYRRLVRVGDAAGVFVGVFGIFTIAQLMMVMAWRPGPQQIAAAWATGPQAPRDHPLLVWIVFDELSYDQTFEHRASGLMLPNFDALRSQSTLYTAMQPIGLKTAKVLPSLLSGAEVDDLQYRYNNTLKVHYAGTHGWRLLDGNGTVFKDAQQAGWRTAVVGWYNPYCTVYGAALDSCYWTNLDRMDGDMAQGNSLAQNTVTPLVQLVHGARNETCDFDVQQRRQTYTALHDHTVQLLAGDQADFIFLHLPIPHTPNIWDRNKAAFRNNCGGSYLDSLAFADRELGSLLTQLRSSPRWKDTVLILQGDHSWRTMMWDVQPGWTGEDIRASHDVFDPRPALLIHSAGQTQPLTDARAMPLLYVHGVVESVLHDRPAQR